jgi:hypothetical protein
MTFGLFITLIHFFEIGVPVSRSVSGSTNQIAGAFSATIGGDLFIGFFTIVVPEGGTGGVTAVDTIGETLGAIYELPPPPPLLGGVMTITGRTYPKSTSSLFCPGARLAVARFLEDIPSRSYVCVYPVPTFVVTI